MHAKSKRGRPAGSVLWGSRRSSGLTHSQRWTGEEWRQVRHAAKREGMTPSAFIRTTVLNVIREEAGQALVRWGCGQEAPSQRVQKTTGEGRA